MTRVSLKEAYDNKDVVAQIYAIRDTAESAEDTAEQAVTTANTASDHVDALVPQVEGAVQNANSASASAQASAQTVAGYENRLGAVETGLGQTESDLSAVTLRVTTAEGNIVTIQGRVTALETADGQNIKINSINDYAVGLTGNQDIDGVKRFLQLFVGRKTRDFSTNASGLTLLYKRTTTRQQWLVGVSGHSLILANVQGNTKINTRVISNSDRPYPQPIMYVCRDSEDVITVWGVAKYSAVVNWYLISNMQYSTDYVSGIEIVNQQYANASVPVVGDVTPYDPNATYTEVYPSTDFEFVR